MAKDGNSGAILPPLSGLPEPASDDDDVYSAWSKQEGETEKAYDAFLTYLQMGGERSIHKSYFVHTGRKVPDRKGARYAPGGWVHRASKNRWAERAREYDSYELARRHKSCQKFRIDAYEKFAKSLPSYVDRIDNLAMGRDNCSGQQFAALLKVFEWAGMQNPNQSGEGQSLNATQNNVHIYIPDNGRGPKDDS